MKANLALLALLMGRHPALIEVPEALRRIVQSIRLIDGRLISSLVHKAPSPPERFHDATSYEVYINSLRMSDFSIAATDRLSLAIALANMIVCEGPDRVAIVICDDDDVIIKFHRKRPGIEWVAEDIEGYGDQAVAVFD